MVIAPHAIAWLPEHCLQQCLEQGKYGTAASYLMIMQTLTSPAASRKRALALLDTALSRQLWDLSRDLVRFLEVRQPVAAAVIPCRSAARSRPLSPAHLHQARAYTLISGGAQATSEVTASPEDVRVVAPSPSKVRRVDAHARPPPTVPRLTACPSPQPHAHATGDGRQAVCGARVYPATGWTSACSGPHGRQP